MLATTFAIGGDLTVRRIGYGGMSLTGLGGWGEPRDPVTARAVLRRAVDLGVQLFDTADSYGPEVSETLIAEALHPYPRDVVIATKGGSLRDAPWQTRADGSPAHLRATCEGSLRRLKLERIDLYQLHAVDPAVPLEDSVGALAKLREEGKVRHVGLSNVTLEQIQRAQGIVPVVSVQNEYSLAARRDEDRLIDYCEREGLAYVPWTPLAKGSLARGEKVLRGVAARRGVAPATVALAWLLSRAQNVIPIPATLDPEHLEQNVAALSLELSSEDLQELGDYRLPAFDPRTLARRYLPPRARRAIVSAIALRRRIGHRA